MQYLIQNQTQDITRQYARPIQPTSSPVNTVNVPVDEVVITASIHPEVNIPQELQNVVGKGPDALPTIATPTDLIHLPMTYEQALKKKNTTQFWDSMHWLAAFIMYQWAKYDPDIVRAAKAKAKTS